MPSRSPSTLSIRRFPEANPSWTGDCLLTSPSHPRGRNRWPRQGGPQLVEDCGPVRVSPKTRYSDSRLHYRPAAKAVVPAIRPPEPTAAQANSVAESTAVLGRPRGRDQKATTSPPTWVNSFTCGWVSGVSCASTTPLSSALSHRPPGLADRRHATAYPWTCADAWHCETNAGHAVGCVSGTYSPLYTECYDCTAWANGLCSDTGSLTGCW